MHRAQIFQEFRIVLRRYPDYLTFPSPIVFSSLQFIHPFLSSPFFPPLPLPSLLFEFRLCIVRFSHFSERREEGRLLESTEDKSSLAAIFRAKYALERERESRSFEKMRPRQRVVVHRFHLFTSRNS